jgi:hypothetical protein
LVSVRDEEAEGLRIKLGRYVRRLVECCSENIASDCQRIYVRDEEAEGLRMNIRKSNILKLRPTKRCFWTKRIKILYYYFFKFSFNYQLDNKRSLLAPLNFAVLLDIRRTIEF